jgi:hypothetical protein
MPAVAVLGEAMDQQDRCSGGSVGLVLSHQVERNLSFDPNDLLDQVNMLPRPAGPGGDALLLEFLTLDDLTTDGHGRSIAKTRGALLWQNPFMCSNVRWILLTCLVGVSNAGAETPPRPGAAAVSAPVPGAEILSELKGHSLVLVPLEGTESSPVTGRKCGWFSVVIGTRGEDGDWVEVQEVFHVESDVQFETPLGRMELSWRKLRPHLKPSWEKVLHTPEDLEAEMDPGLRGALEAQLAEGAGPLTLSESCLLPGEAIAAQIETETYLLPPEPPDFEPGEASNTVLRLSNGAWEDGDPLLPLTAPFDDWSY